MAEITLSAQTGRETGSRATRRLRRDGKIPGVVYGHGTDPLPVAVDARTLRHALNGEAGVNALLRLQLDNGSEQLTVAKVLQRHPVRHILTHVDFQIVRADEEISAEVSINLLGEATKVREQDGEHSQVLFSLTVLAVPSKIPNSIEVDISDLELGDSIRVSDLRLPDGVTTSIDPEETIVSTSVARLAEEEEEAAEGAEEGAEGAEGDEEGGAGASDDGSGDEG